MFAIVGSMVFNIKDSNITKCAHRNMNGKHTQDIGTLYNVVQHFKSEHYVVKFAPRNKMWKREILKMIFIRKSIKEGATPEAKKPHKPTLYFFKKSNVYYVEGAQITQQYSTIGGIKLGYKILSAGILLNIFELRLINPSNLLAFCL